MATIDIKLKTYEQLQFEIMKLNTDIVLKNKEIDRLNNVISELEKWLNGLIDNFDSEISIKFTSKNEEAKMIDEKDKEFYDIILSGLGFEVEFIENE